MRFRFPVRLVDDWRCAHRFASVQLSALFGVALAAGPSLVDAWNALPDDLKIHLPHGWARPIAVSGFALIAIARVFRRGERNG